MSEHGSKTDELPLLLLVEDSHTTTALLSKYLSGSYEMLHASDGVEAWRMLEENPDIDLVITDINMPNMTGHQLLVKIRKNEDGRYSNLPVIVMTTAEDNVDRNLAFLNGANDFITKPIDEMELQARVGVHYRLARTIRELEGSRRALAEQATTDPLTKLRNRRAFFENGARALATARRYVSDLSVILLDIDHFKKINDTYGHQAGDDALIAVAHILSRMTRAEDTVSRIGGEEFAILLPDTALHDALAICERFRAALAETDILAAGHALRITVSGGVAPVAAGAVDAALKLADLALYQAKAGGRDQLVLAA